MAKNIYKHRYLQIAETLRARIREGVYEPGARVPGHTRLAREFGVSPITSNRALQELVQEGLLVRRERAGSFVSTRALSLRSIAIIVAARAGQEGPQFQEYLSGCLKRANEYGIRAGIHHQFEPDVDASNWGRWGTVQGVVSIGQAQYAAFNAAADRGHPFVVVGTDEPPGAHFVLGDWRGCARDMTRMMLEDGYRRVGFIGKLNAPTHRLGRDGYLEAVGGLDFGYRLIRDANEETIGPAVRDLLAPDLGVEAVVVMGANLPVAALPLIRMLRPEVMLGCFRESPTVEQLADGCYFGRYSAEEAGRIAVDLVVDLHAAREQGPTTRHPPYSIHRPKAT